MRLSAETHIQPQWRWLATGTKQTCRPQLPDRSGTYCCSGALQIH